MQNVKSLIGRYAAPGAAILGGLLLLFAPDVAAALVTTVLGWCILAVGLVLTLLAFAGSQGLGAIFRGLGMLAVGLWLTSNPMSLAVAVGKLLGLGLIFGAFGGFRKSGSGAGRTIYLAEGLLGLVLLVSPLTATRTVCTVLGLVLVAAGVVMLLNRLKDQDRLGPGGGKVIDV